MTGIGGWTVADVVKALKMGVNKKGEGLCPPMPAGPMGPFGGITDADAADIAHYLLSIQGVNNPLTGQCNPPGPPMNTDGGTDAGGGDASRDSM